MNRYNISKSGLKNLKQTIHETSALIDNLYWLSLMNQYFEMSLSDMNIKIKSLNYKQFKPKHMNMLNKISSTLGYNDYKELESVSNSKDGNKVDAIIVLEDNRLKYNLIKAWSEEVNAHYNPKSTTVESTLKLIVELCIDAWVINKSPLTKPYSASSKHFSLNRSSNFWSLNFETLDSDREISYIEPTYSGSLLPAFGRWNIYDDLKILDTIQSVASSSFSGIFYKLILRATAMCDIISTLNYDGDAFDSMIHFNLDHLCVIDIKGHDSPGASRLLQILFNIDLNCFNQRVPRHWYTKPMNSTEREKFFKCAVSGKFFLNSLTVKA